MKLFPTSKGFTKPLFFTVGLWMFLVGCIPIDKSGSPPVFLPIDINHKNIVSGAEPVTAFVCKTNRDWEIYIYDSYIIEASLDSILVHFRPSGDKSSFPMVLEKVKNWKTFTLKSGQDNNSFFGCYENYMFVDSGWSSEPRGLAVYDLITQKKVFRDFYSRPISVVKEEMSFWEYTPEKATPENCPDYEKFIKSGGPPGIDEKVFLDLRTMKLRKSGEKRCAYRE